MSGGAQVQVLHFEAVNFAATVFDTQDISTIRGSSRALEDIVQNMAGQIERAGGEVVRAGGAQLTARTGLGLGDLVNGLPESLRAIYPHLSFVTGTGATEIEAMQKARNSQFRQRVVPDWGPAAAHPCMLDRTRPAQVARKLGGETIRISQSVDLRREYGRQARSGLYARLGVAPPEHLPNSFEDLVAAPPSDVAEVARSKLVVIHADGAGFGDALAKVGASRFSADLVPLQAGLMRALLDKLSSLGPRGLTADGALRFETLLFGGEDMDFVLPAWLVFDFLKAFSEATRDWEIGGVHLSHRVGCIIAHRKTPIRQMRQLAHDAVDLLRGCDGVDVFSIDTFESAAPPDDLDAHRRRVFGPQAEPGFFAESLSQAAADLRKLSALAHAGDDEAATSRSQIHTLLAPHHDFAAQGTSADVARAFADFRLRIGRPLAGEEPLSELPFSGPFAMRLAKTALAWDYVGGEG